MSKPPVYRRASCMPGEKSVEANGPGIKVSSIPLHEQIRLPASLGAPDQGGGSKGNRDKRFFQGRLAGHGPMVVLAPSCDPSVLQSIVLDHDSNDGAACDELDDYSTTSSLTSSNALVSSNSSSCGDVPSATVLESYQNCSPAPRQKEEWL